MVLRSSLGLKNVTFPVSPLRRITILVLFLGLSLVLAGLLRHETEPAARRAGYLVVAGLAVLGLALHGLVRYTRLVLSPDGLVLRQLGWSSRCRWDEVERLELRPGHEGLILRRAVGGGAARALRAGLVLPFWYDDAEAELVVMDRWIPLTAFGWWLRHGSLLQQLQAHIAHSGPPGAFDLIYETTLPDDSHAIAIITSRDDQALMPLGRP